MTLSRKGKVISESSCLRRRLYLCLYLNPTSTDDQSCVRTTRIYLTLITTVKTIHVTRRHWKGRWVISKTSKFNMLCERACLAIISQNESYRKFTRLFWRLARMRRKPQRAPKKASKTVYFISGPTHTSLSWYLQYLLKICNTWK